MHANPVQIGQNLSDPFDMEFPSLEEALEVQWGSLKDRWGPPPKPFVVAQGVYGFAPAVAPLQEYTCKMQTGLS